MTIGPMSGLLSSVAGAPLAQTKGSELERAQQEQATQQRQIQSDTRAEAAAGIGEADGKDHETGERDADGRRLWERAAQDAPGQTSAGDAAALRAARAKDPTGQSGSQLDLTG